MLITIPPNEISTLSLHDALPILRDGWDRDVDAVLAEATLARPEKGWQHSGGRRGVHTEHMGYLLAELQYLDRKSTRLNSSHRCISYAVFCLKKKKNKYNSLDGLS